MAEEKDFLGADRETSALRQELTAAREANQVKEEALLRLQHDFSEQQTLLLSQIEQWQKACAEYRDDAVRMRRWRAVRQRIAPDGSLRHLIFVAIKGGTSTATKKGSAADLRKADLILKCEEPNLSAGAKVSGFICVRGWASPRSEVAGIRIFVDEAHVGNAFYGFVRPDVIRSQPELGEDSHLGFAFRLDGAKLSAGMHALKIMATTKNGKSAVVEGNIEVVERKLMEDERSFADVQANHPDLTTSNNHPRIFGPTQGRSIRASVIIFSRNQAEILDRSLAVIAGQKTSFRFELIGFDTESEDGTAHVLKRHGARVVSVRRDEFHHVHTRLKSLSEASGEFVVFFVGDALPFDEHWLEGLVRPLIDDPLVAAAYSRQLPASNCVPWEARDIHLGGSVVREVKQVDWSRAAEIDNYRRNQWKFISFSDVSACYRRALLETVPIPGALPEVEDQYWCKCFLEAGYRVVLEPTSMVIHSHNHSLRQLYRRQVRFGRCFATFMDIQLQSMRNLVSDSVNDTMNDLLFTVGCKANWLRKFKWILQAPVMRFVKRYGLRRGFQLGGFEVEKLDHEMAIAKTNGDAVPVERSK